MLKLDFERISLAIKLVADCAKFAVWPRIAIRQPKIAELCCRISRITRINELDH